MKITPSQISSASGVSSFLGTPSSANFASLLSDKTGTGVVVFSASPTFTGTITAAAITASGAISASNFTGTSTGTNTGDQTSVSGNAGTATALATGRTISITGDLAYTSPSFDGTGNITAAGTLATVNSNTGSFGSTSAVPIITVNGKGLITAVSTAALGTAAVKNTGTSGNTVPLLDGANTWAADQTFSGNAVVSGNFSVLGTTFTVNATNLAVADAIINLAKNNTTGAIPYTGIRAVRGSAGNDAYSVWDEANGQFIFQTAADDAQTTPVGIPVKASRFISSIATGTAPLTVSSTTLVSNLNAEQLGGQTGSYYRDAGNLNAGTLLAARLPALTGDITTSAGAVATTLTTVNSNVGTFGSATQSLSATVNAKGLVTAMSAQTVTPAVGSITGLGTGVATALAAAVTGTGSIVLSASPTLTGTLTAATVNASGHVTIDNANTTASNNTTYHSVLAVSGSIGLTLGMDATNAYLQSWGSRPLVINGQGNSITLGSAITYGGVTLSNAVTGTGNMVLSASPTLTGTLVASNITASGDITVVGALVAQQDTRSFYDPYDGTGWSTAQSIGQSFRWRDSTTIYATLTASGLTLNSALTYGGVTLSNAVTGTGNMVLSASPTLTGTVSANKVVVTGDALSVTGANLANSASVVKLSQETTSISRVSAYGPDASTQGSLQVRTVSSDGSASTFHTFSSTGLAVTGTLSTTGNITVSSVDQSTSRLRFINTGTSGHGFAWIAGNYNIDQTGLCLLDETANLVRMRMDNSGLVTFNNGLAVTGAISATTTVAAAATSGLLLGSNVLAIQTGGANGYHELRTPSGVTTIHLGGSSDPNNYYNNTTHTFRNLAGSTTYASLTSTGLAVTGTLSATGTTTTSGLTVNGPSSANLGLNFDYSSSTAYVYGYVTGTGYKPLRLQGSTVSLDIGGTPVLSLSSGGLVSANSGMNLSGSGAPFTINSTNSNGNKIILQDAGTTIGYLGATGTGAFLADNGATIRVQASTTGAAVTGTLAATGAVTGSNVPATNNIATINYIIDGGGSTITTGIKGDLVLDFACTILSATLLADQSGSVVVDVWVNSYASYPPTVANKITASAPPTISSATKSQDTTLTGWTTAIAAGSTIRFNVNSATTIQRVTLALKVQR